MNEELRIDDDGILWLQDRLVVPVVGDNVVDFSRQHIVHPIPCTLVPPKCIMTYECIIGGKA